MLGLYYHSDFLKHYVDLPRPHFESFETPERLTAVYAYLASTSVFELSGITAKQGNTIKDEALCRFQDPFLIDSVRMLSAAGGGEIGTYSYASPQAFEVAKLAVGTAIQSCEAVLSGKVNQSFALIRPPGHHSGYSKAEGLCIFNNCAVSIKHLLHEKKLDRALIIDLDTHYGDGIAEFFYSDPSVLYISLHEYFSKQERGGVFELGADEGMGYNVNIPLPFFTTNRTYLRAFDKIVPPLVKEFKPELILVAMGFDTHYADPVGNLRLTSQFFATITQRLKTIAEICDGKLALVLEGGYNLATLPKLIDIVIRSLIGLDSQFFDEYMSFDDVNYSNISSLLNTLKNQLSHFWDCF